MIDLSIRLLGQFQVTLKGELVSNLPSVKVQALLAYLATEADQPHSRSVLANLFWPDQPEKSALHNLRQALTTLRRTIGDQQAHPSFLIVTRQTLQFNVESNSWIDVIDFERFQSAGQTPVTAELIANLAQAVELYPGDFLTGLTVADSDVFADWLVTRREYYRRQITESLEQLSAYYEEQGEFEPALDYTRRLGDLAPWQETAHQRMMRCLVAGGQRSEALAYYHSCRQTLKKELDVEPAPETTALFEQIRQGEWGAVPPQHVEVSQNLRPISSTAPPHHYLPAQLTSFIGREAELARLAAYLTNPACRLATLIGPGGVGKTRLALKAAEQRLGDFRDGVYFISLSAIHSSELLTTTIGTVLRLSFADYGSPRAQLAAYLRTKQILLILDNFEHLIDDLDFIIDLLQAAPGLKLMVTSRERLNLQAEWLVDVEGLSIPTQADASKKALANSAALRLFVQRAKQIAPDFMLTQETVPRLIRLCQLTEGLPLAIELAAAQVRTYPLTEVVQDFETNLDRLSTRKRDMAARHRNLRALFDSSWDHLERKEQILFKQLSVFIGGFEVEAAQAVTGATVDDLASLVDKSMLRRTSQRRYELHQLLRQYGAEKLRSTPDQYRLVKNRHTAFYSMFLQQEEVFLNWGVKAEMLEKIEQDIENIRAAWNWAVECEMLVEIDQAQKGLFRLYTLRNWLQEGKDVFERVVRKLVGNLERGQLKQPESVGVVTDKVQSEAETDGQPHFGLDGLNNLQTNLLLCLAYFSDLTADYATALSTAQMALKLAVRVNNTANETKAYLVWGKALWRRGRHKSARTLFVQALQLARATNHRYHEAQSLHHLGNLYRHRGQQRIAREHLIKALDIYKVEGNSQDEAQTLSQLGDIDRNRGHYAAAQGYLEQAVKVYRQVGDRHLEQEPLRSLGIIFQTMGMYPVAQDYFRQVLETAQEFGNRQLEALILNDLGFNTWYLGDAEVGRQACETGLEISQEIRDRFSESYSLTRLGQMQTEAGNFQEAADVYRRALHLRRKIGQPGLAIVDLAGLAWVTFQRGEIDQALAQIEEISAWLEANDTTYLEELPLVYWRCYQILDNLEAQERALALRKLGILDAAYNVLQDRAGRIDDKSLQVSYLENVATHREIITAWQAT